MPKAKPETKPRTKKPKKQSIYDEFIGEDATNKEKSTLENLLTIPIKDTGKSKPHINVGEANYMYQVDTLYLPQDSKKDDKYLIVMVDLATGAMDAIPTKVRDSETASKAVQKMFKGKYLKKKPYTIEVDDGTEFKGDFLTAMKKLDVVVRTKRPGRSRQQASVEGMNGILGKLLNRAMLVDEINTGVKSTNWLDHLPRAIALINKRLTHKPKDLSKAEVTCGKDKKTGTDSCDLIPEGTKVRVISDKPRDFITGKALHGKFRSGDSRWEKEVRTVDQFLLLPGNPPLYKISGIHNATYTKNQLQIVPENEKLPSQKHQKVFIVEKIIGKRKNKNKIEYLVKWKGYPASQNTYEPRTSLIKDIPEMITEFEKGLKK